MGEHDKNIKNTKRGNKRDDRDIESYTHQGERLNNPPVGLVRPETEPPTIDKKHYAYDYHRSPSLHWAGKKERQDFYVDNVPLHIYERIDAKRIIRAITKQSPQTTLFDDDDKKSSLQKDIEFYQHQNKWTNRLVAGDSLLVMNSLLHKESMGQQIQMIYIDPPYGIKYNSNFQPFTDRTNVKDGLDDDIPHDVRAVQAFRDTWELGIHSYLSYLYERLMLARELLTTEGSCFVQISDDNMHLVRNLMDDVFDTKNFVSVISFATSGGFTTKHLSRRGDYLVWYAKDKDLMTYNQLYLPSKDRERGDNVYRHLLLLDGTRRAMTQDERKGITPLPQGARILRYSSLQSQDAPKEPTPFEFEGKTYYPAKGRHWTARYPDGMERLAHAKRIAVAGNGICYTRFLEDNPYTQLTDTWTDTGSVATGKVYAVQTRKKVIERCMLMTTHPGDLVLDPTCGSGTTALMAETWGRRWITCDTSRVALTIAKRRLMTSHYPYYHMASPEEGIHKGFDYETFPHITITTISCNTNIKAGLTQQEIDGLIAESAEVTPLYDKPKVDKTRIRVTGPFTVEAAPTPVIHPLHEPFDSSSMAMRGDDSDPHRQGESFRQNEWMAMLGREGIIDSRGGTIEFTYVELQQGTRYLQARGETKGKTIQTVAFHFASPYVVLNKIHVRKALEEAHKLIPRPELVVFCAFDFDGEAVREIDETCLPSLRLMKVKIDHDILTADLRKKQKQGGHFWLVGQPDIHLETFKKGGDEPQRYRLHIYGFDYFAQDEEGIRIISEKVDRIAMWMVDTDYDGRSVYPAQIFIPKESKSSWHQLVKKMKLPMDEERMDCLSSTTSLPFEAGDYGRAMVKIIDTRGVESMRLVPLV
ncbi:MAG: site-specific DNA-methyltransferase [Alphaproteobacteria bacterium GM7ARS4]|nr:site-specific DNA-methyltransferase [Alphaproteobacteria bacterium GM7ARS4]